MKSEEKHYTPVGEYWAYSIPDLKARLLAEFEAEFDKTLEAHSGDRLFLSFVTLGFSSTLRRAAMKADLTKILESRATKGELEHWARMPSWGSGETAALICGINPDAIRDVEKEIGAIADSNEVARRFEDVRSILRRAGNYSINPLEAINWAERFDLQPPELLRVAVFKMWGDAQLSGPPKEQLPTRTKNNLLRVIAALAKHCGIDIAEGGKGAVQIEAAVASAGFDGPKERTIRSILAEVRKLD